MTSGCLDITVINLTTKVFVQELSIHILGILLGFFLKMALTGGEKKKNHKNFFSLCCILLSTNKMNYWSTQQV